MDVSARVDIRSDFLGYRIEELLGRGGMGVVYRAYDLRLKRPVALKLVAPSLARDTRFLERFARESELVMSLEHPNVVPIYDAGDFEGRVYLAMWLVDGRDLGSVLRAEGPLEPARAIAICAQIASALDAAHARGLVHRDVKPSNVLLDSSEHVYLADFGLTRRLDDDEHPAAEDRSLGTPAYLAPEQLEGGPVDGRADIYSLGCVLYECLTGEPVFPRSSRLAVAWAHLEEEPPRASRQKRGLPEAIDRVIWRALAKEPGARYPSCGALVSAAEQALGLRRSTRLRTAGIAAGAVAVAIAASLAVVLVTRGGGTATPPRTHPNTLVRIDPKTNEVRQVIDVAVRPLAVAAWGRTIWTYSPDHGVVTEVDAQTNHVLQERPTSLSPVIHHPLASGPVLAADAYGAWVVGLDHRGRGVLALVPWGGGRPQRYVLGGRPVAVATGRRSVWVITDGSSTDRLVRLEPATGRMTVQWRFRVSRKVDALSLGFNDVWIVGGKTGRLYRFDPLAHRVNSIDLGQRAGRPAAIFGQIWVGVSDHGYKNIDLVNPRTLEPAGYLDGGVGTGIGSDFATAFGSLWGYDIGRGEVQRWYPPNLGPVVQVTDAPYYDGSCMTSLTAGDRAVWVTLAPSIQSTCNLY